MKEVAKGSVEEFLGKRVQQFPYQRQTKHKFSSCKSMNPRNGGALKTDINMCNIRLLLSQDNNTQAFGELHKTYVKIHMRSSIHFQVFLLYHNQINLSFYGDGLSGCGVVPSSYLLHTPNVSDT
jgi:hypothetical protein